MPLINCEINHILPWSDKCVSSNDAKVTTFEITDTKFYVTVVTSSTQNNSKLLQLTKLLEQLRSGFKKTINLNKYQSKVTIQAPNPHLDYFIDFSFWLVNRLFILSFAKNTDRTVHTKYYLSTVEIKNYNVMIDERNFHKPVKNNLKTYNNI